MLFLNIIVTLLTGVSGALLIHRQNKIAILGCAIVYTIAGEVFLATLIPNAITYQSIICDSVIAMTAAMLCFDDSKRAFLFRLTADANYCLVIPSLVSCGIDAAYDKGMQDFPELIASGLIYSMGGEWLFALFFPTIYSTSSLVPNLITAIVYISFLIGTDHNYAKIIMILIGCTVFVIQKHLNIMLPKIYFDKMIVALKQNYFVEKHVLVPQSFELKPVVYIDIQNSFRQVYNSTINTKKILFNRKLM